jgi:ribosomal protein S18 acetylase RimI-like enzyme
MIYLKKLLLENEVHNKVMAFSDYIEKKYPQLEDFVLTYKNNFPVIITLEEITVHEKHRGVGIGRNVMLELIKFSNKNKFILKLQVRSMSSDPNGKNIPKLRKFYTSLGFKKINTYDFIHYPSTVKNII